MKLFPLLLLTATLAAQTPKPPALPDAVKLKFFKAQSELIQAQQAAQQSAQLAQQRQAAFQTVIEELKKTCGPAFEPQMSKDGEPECAAKPAK